MSVAGGKKVCLGSNYERNIGYIEEILSNILSKLPARHVLSCKRVAKLWNDLITGHHFSELHLSCSRKNPKFIMYRFDVVPDQTRLYLVDGIGSIMPFATFPGFFDIVCSFNGLICCIDVAGVESNIRICNPSTKQFQVLPNGSPSVVTPDMIVVFEPEGHKYKVFRFFLDSIMTPGSNYKCETYVPGAGDWTRVDDLQCEVPADSRPYHRSTVTVGGRTYWLVWSFSDIPEYIISVDMENNFTRVEVPEEIPMTYEVVSKFLVEFQDRLLLISVDGTEHMEIFSLESHHESSWSYVGFFSDRLQEINFDRIISVASLKNEILFIIETEDDNRNCYRLLNMDKLTWRDLQVPSEFNNIIASAQTFTESLLSVM